ncbi:MAG: replication initiation protein [Cetobacterium sp.]|uniref:replication initiation protein n=2 Tax=Cetobacterium sp. TaxID=2071632 RepID=UPI003F40C7CC
MNDIVKYHNDMNKVNLASFSTKELDLFFSICFKLKEMGTDEIKISFNDIKFLIGEENNPKRVKFYIDNLNKKLAQLNYQFEISPNVFERFVLFTNFTSNYNDNSLTIKVNSKFGYLLNNLIGNFTKFDLIEFVNLKSSYSKNMFKFLKQWESIKVKEFKIDEFRELLNIPKGFTISKIDERILKPIMDELPQYFSNLNLQKIKTGRSVTSLKFTWSGKVEKIASQKKVDVIDIIEISDKLNKVIEKVKQNRFIKPLLIIDNIEILVEMFQEKDLIKGLNWSYKEIKQEIKSLNYLIKSIKTGMEQKEKKLVVKTVPEIVQEQEIKEEILKENNLDLEKDQELKITEIEKVTKDEYEELYKKFLQEQNTEHNLLTRKGFDIANKNKYEIIENKKQKIQEELVSSIYKIFMVENKLEESLESKKLFDEYLEKNYILTNDFESKEEWNNFLEFQDEVLNKEGYLTTKELNQDLTYDEYKEHLESETEDDYNSLGEVLLSNESLKENFQEQKTPLNDETLLEEIKIREQFSELFKNREDYNLAWLKNQIELEELKQILNKKKNKTEIKKLENIETEKLLSKKGTPLKGGALVARLEKIARDENIKIQYKDKIIGE